MESIVYLQYPLRFNNLLECNCWIWQLYQHPSCAGIWYLLTYFSRYFDQETAKGSFRSSSQAATYYYLSNHSKV